MTLERSPDTQEQCQIPRDRPQLPRGWTSALVVTDPNSRGLGGPLSALLILYFKSPHHSRDHEAFPAVAQAGNDTQGLAGRSVLGLAPPSPPLPGKQRREDEEGSTAWEAPQPPAASRAVSVPQCNGILLLGEPFDAPPKGVTPGTLPSVQLQRTDPTSKAAPWC